MDVYSWFRRIKTSLPSYTNTQTKKNPPKAAAEEEEEEEHETIYGITAQLIEFVNSFTLDTFKNFNLEPDEEEVDNGSGQVRKDLSDWQERHASLVLPKAKELSRLRFRLCPGFMKERKFWRIYFSLVKSYVADYELRAVRLKKLREMKMENGTSSSVGVYEVEMSEAKQPYCVESADSFDHNLDQH